MNAKAKRKTEGSTSFEERLKRLEEIVNSLEKGEIPLNDTLKLFEEGRDLTRGLVKELDEAESKIEILIKDSQGNLKLEPFEPPGTLAEDVE